MARGKKVPDSVVSEIVEKLESGATRKEIMQEYHLGYDKIESIANDHGLSGKMSDYFRELFSEEWSHIYPGDSARRKRMDKKKESSNKLPDSIGRIKEAKVFKEEVKSEFSDENDREFYAKFIERWANIYPGDEVRKARKASKEVII